MIKNNIKKNCYNKAKNIILEDIKINQINQKNYLLKNYDIFNKKKNILYIINITFYIFINILIFYFLLYNYLIIFIILFIFFFILFIYLLYYISNLFTLDIKIIPDNEIDQLIEKKSLELEEEIYKEMEEKEKIFQEKLLLDEEIRKKKKKLLKKEKKKNEKLLLLNKQEKILQAKQLLLNSLSNSYDLNDSTSRPSTSYSTISAIASKDVNESIGVSGTIGSDEVGEGEKSKVFYELQPETLSNDEARDRSSSFSFIPPSSVTSPSTSILLKKSLQDHSKSQTSNSSSAMVPPTSTLAPTISKSHTNDSSSEEEYYSESDESDTESLSNLTQDQIKNFFTEYISNNNNAENV